MVGERVARVVEQVLLDGELRPGREAPLGQPGRNGAGREGDNFAVGEHGVGQVLQVGDRRSAGLGLGERLQQLRATEHAGLTRQGLRRDRGGKRDGSVPGP